ncbi:MAG: HAD family hydrolase [Candidatus Hecatellaceae archaeon]
MAGLPGLQVRVVLFDCVGTLFRVEVNHELQLRILHERLVEAGFASPYRAFLEAYEKAYARHLKVRIEELREVSNGVWTAEALRILGYQADPSDHEIERAVEAYFKPYIEAVKPIGCLRNVMESLKPAFKLGVVTNFTYAPAMREILSKIGVLDLLDAVTISHEVGWRKPHPKIFQSALKAAKAEARETVFVGDDPYDDVAGARKAGIFSVLVEKPGNTGKISPRREEKPDLRLPSICSLKDFLGRG